MPTTKLPQPDSMPVKPVLALCPVLRCTFEASASCEDDALSAIGQHIITCHPAQAETARRV